MLKEKIIYVSCGPKESFLQSTEEGAGIGNEEKRNIISFG